MATQNFFEQYGIKEVANVTLSRIEKKEETYESQRTISVSSIIKGAAEIQTVYPLINGVGSTDGFEAYVFADADIITGENFDCDDVDVSIGSADEVEESEYTSTIILKEAPLGADIATEDDKKTYIKTRLEQIAAGSIGDNVKSVFFKDSSTGKSVPVTAIRGASEITVSKATYNPDSKTFTIAFVATSEDTVTGANATGSTTPDAKKVPGTHEYTYAQQICMLFSRNQNLITKTGTRYQFTDIDTMFGEITFNDNFAAAPYSKSKVVVIGLIDRMTEGTYDISEVNDAINGLTKTYTAKAYNVTYGEYAELVVEDEMGYYRPDFLGYAYERNADGTASMTKFDATGANSYAQLMTPDRAILNAQMWDKGVHYSINDAIAALRQKKQVLDSDTDSTSSALESIFGGYKVGETDKPDTGNSDLKDNNTYSYKTNSGDTGKTSLYSLEKVKEVLDEITLAANGIATSIRVDANGEKSNRAIYVDISNVDLAASGYIYLLHNKNAAKLSADEDGIFQFEDKKGNTLYYQDKIFAKTEWLALVIIGTQGMIFVVERHGKDNTERVAWMMNEGGYITNRQAKSIVANGLLHTTPITINDETFEATCAVKSLVIRKITKTSNRYVPALFLDTLKVSTLEQTAEDVYAQGGKGNARLIGWDFNKEITLTMQDALFTPASMSAIFGSFEGSDFRKGIKNTTVLDRTEPITAKRNFIIPAGNSKGVPTQADKSAQAVYLDPMTMEPYPDGTPIAEGEEVLKWTRSVAYEGGSLGKTIEISADSFPGTYQVTGDTLIRNKDGVDQRFQFVIPLAKMTAEQTITLEADGDPTVFDMNMTVLRPSDGVMVRFIQYDVVENTEENDGSTMVKGTENLNLLDDAELFKVSSDGTTDEVYIGATEY